jgi:hypothetical protein
MDEKVAQTSSILVKLFTSEPRWQEKIFLFIVIIIVIGL